MHKHSQAMVISMALDSSAHFRVTELSVILVLYARFLCSRAHSAYAAARPSVRATIEYLVYKFSWVLKQVVPIRDWNTYQSNLLVSIRDIFKNVLIKISY